MSVCPQEHHAHHSEPSFGGAQDSYKFMQQRNFTLETKNSEMESEMNVMKNRLKEVESRQRQLTASQQRKVGAK